MPSLQIQIETHTLKELKRLAKASQIPIDRLIDTAINELLSFHANAKAIDLIENSLTE